LVRETSHARKPDVQRTVFTAIARARSRPLFARIGRRKRNRNRINLVILGYTCTMKTAISLPDDIFDRASRRANDLGMSRSEFFARAAGSYLDELDSASVTKQIDAALVAIGDDGESNDWAVEAGRAVLVQGTDEW
jgi:hypothetical protein